MLSLKQQLLQSKLSRSRGCGGGIPWISFIPPHVCAYPKPELGFLTSYVMVFSLCSMMWCERWFYVVFLLILLDLFSSITFFSSSMIRYFFNQWWYILIIDWLIDWLIDCSLTSSGKYMYFSYTDSLNKFTNNKACR